jgi:N-acetyl-gamma-glutamyl-phosphate reductase
MNKIKVAIIGSTGYAGEEIFRILNGHQNVEVIYTTSISYIGKQFSSVYPNFNKITNIVCNDGADLEKISKDVDIMFLSLPYGIVSNQVNNKVLSNAKVIDLGADFRLNSQKVYEKWYKVEHGNPNLLNSAVYGLCEIYREKIKNSSLIANPGCYTTCSILSLFPLVKEKIIDFETIIIDAKSGVSGAGRSANLDSLYCECNENIKAYKIGSHRHIPEIEQELSLAGDTDIKLSFTPHLIPMNRGILATIYAKLNKSVKYKDVKEIYEKYYKNEYFVRLLEENCFPETRWVKGSNFIDIGFKIDNRTNNIVIVGAIDNLVKGSAGQAIQNMNIMFNFEEKMALNVTGIFPA